MMYFEILAQVVGTPVGRLATTLVGIITTLYSFQDLIRLLKITTILEDPVPHFV